MRVLIADDEPLARERLGQLLAEVPEAEVVGQARDGREAINLTAELKPDTVLLDIAMPTIDGIEAARHISALETPPAVVFCTAYDEYALQAFEASAVDFVVKPIRRERLAAALEKARKFTADRYQAVADQMPLARRTHICARLRGNLKLVPVNDIMYFLAEDKYVVVRYEGGDVLIEESLRGLEQEFGERFVRIHRNCLVAVDRLGGLNRAPDGRMFADVRGSEQPLEVSRRNLPALRKLVKTL